MRGRKWGVLGTFGVAGAAAITSILLVSSGGSGGGTSASVFLSTSGSDSNAGTTIGAPVASLSKALNTVTAGGTIQMAAGTYGTAFGCANGTTARNQFSVSQGFASNVTVTVASGATVIIPCQVNINGNYVGFDGTAGTLNIDGAAISGAHNFLTNVHLTCTDASPYPLYASTQAVSSPGPGSGAGNYCSAPLRGSGTFFTMTGGEIGPTYQDNCSVSSPNGLDDSTIGAGSVTHADNWTINGVHIHNNRFGGPVNGCRADNAHTENLFLDGMANLTIENSLIDTCGSSNCLFFGENGKSYTVSNALLINDIVVGKAADIETGVTITFQNVTMADGAPNLGSQGVGIAGSSFTATNSMFDSTGCPENANSGLWSTHVTYSHNIWMHNTSGGSSASNCGGTGTIAYNVAHDPKADIFVNYAGADYHQKTSTNPAVDIGTATCASASPDYFSVARPVGAACDIGAAERTP